MFLRALTAGAIALLAIAAAPVALQAADLDSYDASPYDDPRYGDVYRHPPPPPRPYVDRYGAPHAPAPPPPPYAYRDAPPRGEPYGCVPREVARAALERQGWMDFHNLQLAGQYVHLRARRPNGAVFELTLDRCSGQVLDRRFVSAAPPAYAWRERGRDYRGY